jgi:hypothetical protein
VKRPRRGHRYRALAHGFKILKSPIAASFKAAAEHYDPTDAPPMRSEGSIESAKREPGTLEAKGPSRSSA